MNLLEWANYPNRMVMVAKAFEPPMVIPLTNRALNKSNKFILMDQTRKKKEEYTKRDRG